MLKIITLSILMLTQGVFSMTDKQINELKKMGAVIETNPKYPRIISYKMKNGLTILMYEKHVSPVVAFTTMFKVGNVDNIQGQTGLAHLFEHMAFKGTDKIGTKDFKKEKKLLDKINQIYMEINREDKKENKDINKIKKLTEEVKKLEDEIEKYQVREEFWKIYNKLGQNKMNAFTSTDYTGYVVELPSDRIEAWFKIESDRFQNPVLRDFYRERNVVLEELRMGKSDPSRILWENLLSHAFVAHPYHNPTIGWEDDVRHLTQTDAEKFYKRFYGPNNCTIAIVGDINPVEVIELAEKYFSNWKPVNLPDTNYTKEPPQNARKEIQVDFKAKPMLRLGFKNPGYSSPDTPALIVLSEILTSGNTSRLYKKLVEEKGVALDIGSYYAFPGLRYPSLFVIAAAPKGKTTVEELEQEIINEIKNLSKNPPTEWELEKVINNYEASLLQQLEDNLEFSTNLAHSQQILGDWKSTWDLLEKIKKVKPEDIVRVAEKYINENNETFVYIK